MIDVYKTTILKSFEENFQIYKEKNIVIYGTGVIAGFIMEKFYEYNIVGFLDGKRKHGTAYGKKIFSYEEIANNKPDIIIIAATRNNIETIYDRISYLCYTNNIPVYSIDGRNLFSTFGYGGLTDEQQKYQDINEISLRDKIKKHDIISFDIFDVLIMKKTLLKTDLVDIVENKLAIRDINVPNYKELRLRCEQEVTKNNGSIYDIYSKLIQYAGIKENIADKALKLELEVENNILCCREKMKELLSFSVQEGKKVYLIADTYFPKEIIKSFLDKFEITGYEDVILSCEYNKTKEQGLYNVLKSRSKGNTYLHVGTNFEKSKDFTEENNVSFFQILSSYDLFKMSSYRNLSHSLNSINERSILGILLSRVFNDPFSLYHAEERPMIDSIYDFGYIFIAPLITKYVLWIIDRIKNSNYTDVLFAARDGMIVNKLYDFAVKELSINVPKGVYFQTSRTVCTNASVKNEEDIKWIADVPYAYEPDLMIRRRFNLDLDDVEKYDPQIHTDVVSYALQYKKKIFEKSESIRNNYLKYMKNIGLEQGKKYAFVDFVSSGTCQLLLNRFIPFEIDGLYFCRYNVNDEAKMMLPIESLFENLMEKYVYCSNSFESYMLLETIMTSTKPSLASINSYGEPVLGEEKRSSDELNYVEEIHSATEEFFCEFIKVFYIDGVDINKHFVDTIFSYRGQRFTNECCTIFDNLMLLDDFGQGKIPLHRC